MPNNIPILDLSPSCPSSCSLIGTASNMRDFLLLKNLPNAPSDVTIAGLESEWTNNGNVVQPYNNLDPQSLTDPGDVFTDTTPILIKHKNINLYEYDAVYPLNGQQYTEYPLLNIDDSIAAITWQGTGNVEAWVDSDDVIIAANTWETKWVFELGVGNNKFRPGAYYGQPYFTDGTSSQGSHASYIYPNYITPVSINPNSYSVTSFILDATNETFATQYTYFEQKLNNYNKYNPLAGHYAINISTFNGGSTSYVDWNTELDNIGTLLVNNGNKNIDLFDFDIIDIGATEPTPSGFITAYGAFYNDYYLINPYNPTINGVTNALSNYQSSDAPLSANAYDTLIANTRDKKDTTISDIDSFAINVPELSNLDGGLLQNSGFATPTITMKFMNSGKPNTNGLKSY